MILLSKMLEGLALVAKQGHIVETDSQTVENNIYVTDFNVFVLHNFRAINRLILRFVENDKTGGDWVYNSPNLHGVGNFHPVTIENFIDLIKTNSEWWDARTNKNPSWFKSY